ncbi:MAG TPA: T9SS type A sorting domain-containing protein [bacterium]|jgi:hypothetical protein
MKTLLIAAALLLTSFCFAQPPDTMWTHAYGGPDIDDAAGVCRAFDGGFVIAGRSRQAGQFDFLGVRTDAFGDTVWMRRYGGPNSDAANAVCSTRDSTFVLVGSTMSFGAGAADMYAVKVNLRGDTLWTRTYGAAGNDVANAVQQTADGGLMIAGTADISGSTNLCLVRTDSAGNALWTRTYGTSAMELFGAAQQTADGGFALIGTTFRSGAFNPDIYLVKTNSAGDTLWTHTYGGAGVDYGNFVRQCSDGGYVIGGTTQSFGAGGNDCYLIRLNSSGVQQWYNTYGFAGADRANCIRQGTDGGFLLAGVTDHYSNSYDFFFVKTNSQGAQLWTLTEGGHADDWLSALELTADGGYIAVGYTLSFGHGSDDFYAVRLPGFAGVGGYVRDRITHQPLAGVVMSTSVGQSRVRSDIEGHYALPLPPGTYDVVTYGPCTARDTFPAIAVLADSITTLDVEVGLTAGVVEQSSLNFPAHNHLPTADTLWLDNSGVGLMDYSVDCFATAPSGTWLSAFPQSGSIAPGTRMGVAVQVLADTTNDGIYDYFGYLTVHMNTCPDSVARVTVMASVLDAGAPRATVLPSAFALGAYPNPFNAQTTLTLSLPQRGDLSLAVYDIAGREVQRLQSGVYDAGIYRFRFDAAALPSGLYFVRAMTARAVLTRKVLLLK